MRLPLTLRVNTHLILIIDYRYVCALLPCSQMVFMAMAEARAAKICGNKKNVLTQISK